MNDRPDRYGVVPESEASPPENRKPGWKQYEPGALRWWTGQQWSEAWDRSGPFCPGCGIFIEGHEAEQGACDSCQKEEMNRQANEMLARQQEEEFYQAEREAGRL